MTLKLEARRRVGLGKGAGRRIRTSGLIPAVLYGGSAEPVNLAVAPRDVKALLDSPTGTNTIFQLEVNGGETVEMVLLKDYQKHPLRRTLVHCDLLRLDPAKARKFKVPLKLEGVCPAQKLGAKVRFVTRDVVIRCLPAIVPEAVSVDISRVQMGDIIRLKDVVPPAGVELLFGDNAPVFVAAGSVVVETEDAEAAEPAKV